MYYTYIIRCSDNSLYTGITTDYNRRFEEHKNKTDKCAKYTLRHSAESIEAVWQSNSRADASKLEYRIKHLNKEQKEKIILDKSSFVTILNNLLEVKDYVRIKL